MNESQERSSPQIGKTRPDQIKSRNVQKLDSNMIEAQAVNINSSDGSAEPQGEGVSVHIPTGIS